MGVDAHGNRRARFRIGWEGVHDQYRLHVDRRPARWEQPFMMYLIILFTALACVGVATPLTILTLRWIERTRESPSPLPAPKVEPQPEPPRRIRLR